MTAKGYNSNQLKLIAIIAMTVDHLAWTLWSGYSREWYVLLMHILGRLTAPIMWFFIAEGYHHTRSVERYLIRLFLLAAASHFAYNFCFGISFLPSGPFNQTSVVWSLAWGLALLAMNDSERLSHWQKVLIVIFACLITFPADWSCIATMAVFSLGVHRGDFRKQMISMMTWSCFYAVVYFFFIDRVYAFVQLFTCLSIPLLRLYNGQRGSWKPMGKVFYFYYPVHLVLCGLLRILLWGTNAATGAAHFS